MYRVGVGKFTVAAIIPANALAIAKIDGTLGVLKFILISFQVLLGLWLASMATVAILAFFFRRKVDLRTPRVEIPDHLAS